MRKKRLLVSSILALTILLPGSFAYARFRGGNVFDPTRYAKQVAAYKQQLDNAIHTARHYSVLLQKLTPLTGHNLEKDQDNINEALDRISEYSDKYLSEDSITFDPQKWIEVHRNYYRDKDSHNTDYASLKMDFNAAREASLKQELADMNQYLSAIDEINKQPSQGHLSELQKGNYQEALSVLRSSREIYEIINKFSGKYYDDKERLERFNNELMQNEAVYYTPAQSSIKKEASQSDASSESNLGLKKF